MSSGRSSLFVGARGCARKRARVSAQPDSAETDTTWQAADEGRWGSKVYVLFYGNTERR